MYNKKSLSTKAKLRHYHTVILPETLYTIETSSLTIYINDIEKVERQILRKLFGSKVQDGIWMRKSSQELYSQTERFSSVSRKRRLKFYGHIVRMDDSRLTKKIFHVINGTRQSKVRWLVHT